MKFAVEDPAFTVTVEGTAAFPLNVTVHVEDAGGVTLDGLQLKPDNTIAGVNVSVNGFEVEPNVAVITADV